MCNTFAVYFQIFATFGYKKVKNSEIIVRFWYFLLIILLLFLRWRQPQVSKTLPAACHRVLEEVFAAVHCSRFSG